MFTMFGDSGPKKEPEVVKPPQQPPQPPVNKETNINALFGTGPVVKNDSQNAIKSPTPARKEMNFNF